VPFGRLAGEQYDESTVGEQEQSFGGKTTAAADTASDDVLDSFASPVKAAGAAGGLAGTGDAAAVPGAGEVEGRAAVPADDDEQQAYRMMGAGGNGINAGAPDVDGEHNPASTAVPVKRVARHWSCNLLDSHCNRS
jgi:hypothetical protein